MVLHSKLRSWLTILGIVIGVAAVIAIVSLSNALEQDIGSQFDDLGVDLITLSAGASRASNFGPGGGPPGNFGGGATSEDEEIELDKSDLQVLKANQYIKSINTQISGSADIYYVAEQGSVTVTGVDPATWSYIANLDLSEGRLLGPADTNVIVIGGRLAEDYFDKILGINQLVTIEDRLFRVVGIIDDSSTSIYMPISSAYDVLEDKERDVYDSIIIQVKDESEVDAAMEDIEYDLMISRHVTADTLDFTLRSNQESQDQRAEAMSSMTTFLTAIAAVALLVGAVGVTNTMFTSVLEKTKEIGIMKAIGARNGDILKIFILNASLIGLIGGVLGIILGILLSSLLPSLMGESAGMMSRMFADGAVTLNIILIGIGMSVLLGVLSGMIPAIKASKLKPVDALRYE